MIVLYNPKKYNKKPSAPINDIFMSNRYKLGVNQMAQFDETVADYLLKKYGFLKRVRPEEIQAVKAQMDATDFPCEFCDEEFTNEKALNMHKLGKHKLSKENQETLDSVPVAKPVARVGRGKTSLAQTPDQAEGIPDDGKKDRDGVEWYGEGAQEDTLTDMRPVVPGSKGVFGG